MVLFLSIIFSQHFLLSQGNTKAYYEQGIQKDDTKQKANKKIGLERVDYDSVGAAFQLSFLPNTRDFTQIAKMWLKCSDLETQHLLAENKRAVITI